MPDPASNAGPLAVARVPPPVRRPALFAALLLLTAGLVHAQTNNECDQPGEEPDLILGDIHQKLRHGTSGGVTAFSIGTVSCNLGTCWANWFGFNEQHPVIGQNMFRLKDGRFEQIGQSWLKHGANALSEELCETGCIPTVGTHLGVNCSDPYTANFNGQQTQLGPKFEVNPVTGDFPYPATDMSQSGISTYKRLQVQNTDLDPALNAGATYFVEGQYVSADDSAAGNQNNNASWRPVDVSGAGSFFDFTLTGQTQREEPAILAWQDSDPGVMVTIVDVAGDGRFYVASRATDLGGGTWRYEYAVQNLNSHRAARSFQVPVPFEGALANQGFHDVDYHSGEPFSGTDWDFTVDAAGDPNTLTWSTDSFAVDPNANALRWGTLYNFRFDVNAPPLAGEVTLGLFRAGDPAELRAGATVPDLCDDDGGCELGENSCSCAADCGAPPAIELVCDDLIDDDCDGLADCVDLDCCTAGACAGLDGDADGYVSCDCDDGDPGIWLTPGEARDLTLVHDVIGGTTLSWAPPAEPGADAVTYDTLRSADPGDFVAAAACLPPADPAATTNSDGENPIAGAAFHYLVRALNGCPAGTGTLGTDSAGLERSGTACP